MQLEWPIERFVVEFAKPLDGKIMEAGKGQLVPQFHWVLSRNLVNDLAALDLYPQVKRVAGSALLDLKLLITYP